MPTGHALDPIHTADRVRAFGHVIIAGIYFYIAKHFGSRGQRPRERRLAPVERSILPF